MLRRPRPTRLPRPAAVLVPLALVAALGAACGDATTVVSGSLPGTEAFEVSGDVGSTPEVAWEAKMTVDESETDVLTEGDGPELEDGDQVLVNYYVGNGFTQRASFDTYDEGQVPTVFPVGRRGRPACLAAAQPAGHRALPARRLRRRPGRGR